MVSVWPFEECVGAVTVPHSLGVGQGTERWLLQTVLWQQL